MPKSTGAVAALPAAVVGLCMAFTPALAQKPGLPPVLEGPILTRTEVVPTVQFCPGNRFTNGDFTDTGGTDPDGTNGTATHQDINLADGWLPPWSGNSLADLHGPAATPTNALPNPASGNYAAMWIYNGAPSADNLKYREGMFNRLRPGQHIPPNSGIYQFKFKAAPISDKQSDAPSVIGVYGVNWAAGGNLGTPLKINVPLNKDLFGTGSGVLLRTVEIPSTADRNWVEYKVTFDSAGLPADINHVMVTRADYTDYPPGLAHAYQARYIAFDEFCMQTAVDAGLPPPPPPAPDCPGPKCTNPDLSTCCPPSAAFPIKTLFAPVQGNVAGTYHMNFTMSQALDAQMAAYVALAKTLDPNFKGLAMTVRVSNGGSGLAAVLGAALEPDAYIYWNAGAATAGYWPSASFFTAASNLPSNHWTVVETWVWSLGPGRPYSPNCEYKRFSFMPDKTMRQAGPTPGIFADFPGPPSKRPPGRRRP